MSIRTSARIVVAPYRADRTTRGATAGIAAVVAMTLLRAAPVAATIKVACDPVALQAAVANVNAAGGGKLKLASSCVYAITTPSTATDALPTITGDVTIVGGKTTVIARDPAAPTDFRLFDVAVGGSLTLKKLTLAHGKTAALGGAIQNAGTLVLRGVTVSDNAASNGGGIANNVGGTATIIASNLFLNSTTGVGGGAILNSGILAIKKSLVANNTAPINGGGINTQASGDSTVVRSTVQYNVSVSLGGGLSNLGTTTLNHAVIKFNTGSNGGALATANTNVFIDDCEIGSNIPDNCSPLNTTEGCVD